MQPGGKAPLAYTGVMARRPPDTVVENRAPTSSDINYIVPTLWVDYSALDIYILVNVAGTATWIYVPTYVVDSFITDSGTAVPNASGDVNVLGGTGITTSGSGNTITITSLGAGFDWQVVTAATQTLAPGTAYLANAAGGVTFSLPASASVGDTFIICGMNAGGWVLDQQTGQTVDFNGVTTTTTTGTLTSTRANDQIILVCSVADTEFVAFAPVGNLLVDGGTGNNSVNSTTLDVDVNTDVVSVGTTAAPATLRTNDADLSLGASTICASLDSASTNVGVSVASIEARSTGTVAAGFGPGLQFNAADDAGTIAAMGSVRQVWVDPTAAGGYTSRYEVNTVTNSTSPSVAFQVTQSDVHLPLNSQTISGTTTASASLTICSVNGSDDRYFPSTATNHFIVGQSSTQPNGSQSTWALNSNGSGSTSNSDNVYGDMYMAKSGGNPTNGFGAYLLMSGNDGSGIKTNGGMYGWAFSDVTSGTASTYLRMQAVASGAQGEVLRVSSSGISTNSGTNYFLFSAGTFTPTISGTTTAGTGTYSVQVGRYTVTGGQVCAQATLTWSAHTGTGNGLLSLPFATANVANQNSCMSIEAANYTFTAGATPTLRTVVNSATMNINEMPSGGGSIANVALDTAATVRWNGTFFTT